MKKISVPAVIFILVFVGMNVTSCKSPSEDRFSPEFKLNEMVKELKKMGDPEELRYVNVKSFGEKNKMEVLSENALEVTLDKETGHGTVRLSYEVNNGTNGALTNVSFVFEEKLENEKVDKLSKKLSKLFEEEAEVRYEKPVSEKGKIKYYTNQEESLAEGANIYYEEEGMYGTSVSVEVSKGFGDNDRSYYFRRMYDYELNE